MTNHLKKARVVATLAAAVALTAAAPVSAGKGGNPAAGSCGLGKPTAHEAIADPTSPGATEASRVPPAEVGCTGKG
jgi:hypothetical protein